MAKIASQVLADTRHFQNASIALLASVGSATNVASHSVLPRASSLLRQNLTCSGSHWPSSPNPIAADNVTGFGDPVRHDPVHDRRKGTVPVVAFPSTPARRNDPPLHAEGKLATQRGARRNTLSLHAALSRPRIISSPPPRLVTPPTAEFTHCVSLGRISENSALTHCIDSSQLRRRDVRPACRSRQLSYSFSYSTGAQQRDVHVTSRLRVRLTSYFAESRRHAGRNSYAAAVRLARDIPRARIFCMTGFHAIAAWQPCLVRRVVNKHHQCSRRRSSRRSWRRLYCGGLVVEPRDHLHRGTSACLPPTRSRRQGLVGGSVHGSVSATVCRSNIRTLDATDLIWDEKNNIAGGAFSPVSRRGGV